MFKCFLSFLFPFILFLSIVQANTPNVKPFCDKTEGNVVVIEENDCVIYSPNPSTDGVVTITATEEASNILSVTVFDINGAIVLSQTYQQHQISADLSILSEGNYTIQVTTSTCTGRGRCMIY